MEIAVLGLGCFWGPEIKFSKLEGVNKTEVGYCGGDSKETTYKEVCSGNTNHAEVVKLEFNPKIISYEKILEFFFEIHDPTQNDGQGPDRGSQYLSQIFYYNQKQKQIVSAADCGFIFAGDAANATKLASLMKTHKCSVIGNVKISQPNNHSQ